MHAVGLGQGGQVGPIIDHRSVASSAGQPPQAAGTVDQFAVGQPLVAQLEDIHAGLNQHQGQLLEFFHARSPIQQDIKPCGGQSLQPDPRRIGRPLERVGPIPKLLDCCADGRVNYFSEFFQAPKALLKAEEVGG